MDEQQLRDLLSKMPKKDLEDWYRRAKVATTKITGTGPKTDDELHAWIHENLGLWIPRVAVCDNHCAPFDFVSDVYFHRTKSAIAMANRGGAKTHNVSLIIFLNAEFRSKVEAVQFGSTQAQSSYAYEHLRRMINYIDPTGDKISFGPFDTRTIWKNGTEDRIVAGTKAGVNGLHPQFLHADEIDLLQDEDVFWESRNMTQSKLVDGINIPAQDIITSTRKSAYGLMQRLIDEINEAKLAGRDPMYDLYTWCIFETAAQVKNCVVAFPNAPNHCGCDRIVKGKWPASGDGEETGNRDRTLKDVCRGRLAKSDGWISYDDVTDLFRKNTQPFWEAQQECMRPSTEGLVVPAFSRQRHVIHKFDPDPANGKIYQGIDFGTTNPACVEFVQVLEVDVEVMDYEGNPRRLKEGTYVYFSEIYRAEMGNTQLAKEIKKVENLWRQRYGIFRIAGRFCDPQGAGGRKDLYQEGLPSQWYASRHVPSQVRLLNDLIHDDLIVFDASRCPMLIEEIELWHYPKVRSGSKDNPEIPVDEFDHAMSALRYSIANIMVLRKNKSKKRVAAPKGSNTGHYTSRPLEDQLRSSPTGHVTANFGAVPADERWRFAGGFNGV